MIFARLFAKPMQKEIVIQQPAEKCKNTAENSEPWTFQCSTSSDQWPKPTRQGFVVHKKKPPVQIFLNSDLNYISNHLLARF